METDATVVPGTLHTNRLVLFSFRISPQVLNMVALQGGEHWPSRALRLFHGAMELDKHVAASVLGTHRSMVGPAASSD